MTKHLGKKKGKKRIPFKEAVEQTPDVSVCYCKGLIALGTNSRKVVVRNTSGIGGSLDIDGCTTTLYPQSNRWDYAFEYNKEVYFVEVHTANTREVRTVIRKLKWLKDWLHKKAPLINQLKATSKPPFYWVQSNNFNIPKSTPQYRAAVGEGIVPIPQLVL